MPRRPIHYGWVVVAAIATMLMVAAGARLLFGVVLVQLEAHFGASRSTLTGAVLLNMVVVSVLQPVVGSVGDRIGAKRVLVVGCLLVGALLVPLSFATAVWQLYLLYGVVAAVGFAAVSPVNTTTLVNRWFVERRGTALALATSGTAFGQLLIVPLATWTLVRTDWQTTYRLLAALLIVVVAPLGVLLLREPTRAASARGRWGERRDGGAPAATVLLSLRSPAFWLLAYGFLVCGFTMAFANTHFMAFADDMGMEPMAAADVIAVVAIFSIIGTVLLGLLADRFQRPPVLALTYALRGLSFLLLFFLPVGSLTFVYAVVLGVSWTATTPLTAAIAGDLYGHANLGAIFGAMFTFMHIGFGLGAYLDGLMYDLGGQYHGALIANGVLGLTAALAAALVRTPRVSATARRHSASSLAGTSFPAD